MPQRIIPDWRPQMLAELRAQDLAEVLALEPEVVLLGTGQTLRFPSPELFSAFHSTAIGIEVMDTGAACRTYNILAVEGRQVVAALLLKDG